MQCFGFSLQWLLSFWSMRSRGEVNDTPLQCSCLESPMDGEAWWAAVHGVAKSQTRLSNFTFTHWRRKWQLTPVFLPGESQRRGSLVGCRLWVAQSRTRLKQLSSSSMRSRHAGSVIAAHRLSALVYRLSCSIAGKIFLDQGLNSPYPIH